MYVLLDKIIRPFHNPHPGNGLGKMGKGINKRLVIPIHKDTLAEEETGGVGEGREGANEIQEIRRIRPENPGSCFSTNTFFSLIYALRSHFRSCVFLIVGYPLLLALFIRFFI